MTSVRRQAKVGSPIALGKGSADHLLMPTIDSVAGEDGMARARALLDRPPPRERVWPALGAASLLALSALTFAAAMIVAPPLTSEHVAHQRGVK